ncbi:hypothetical protein HYT23_06650 [Candidatus Pacearchaeota archaeon]|nr:hypothetical protein [Candidatus Pacearchaeota archaeon]
MADDSWSKLGKICAYTGIGTLLFAGSLILGRGSDNGWGSRGVRDIYNFQYQGRPASVQRDDRILGKDTYSFLLPDSNFIYEKVIRNVRTDDNKIIEISNDRFSWHIRSAE